MSADKEAEIQKSIQEGATLLGLTPPEERLYIHHFRGLVTDTGETGLGVTAVNAFPLFTKTRLELGTLAEIWKIADKRRIDVLTFEDFGIALRLIGRAQSDQPDSERDIVNKGHRGLARWPGPLPRFDDAAPSNTGPSKPPVAAVQAQTSGSAVRIPPLTPDDVNHYSSWFKPTFDGTVSKKDAMTIFEMSGKSREALDRVWTIVDTEQRGALVQVEFIIAMHLLDSMAESALLDLPRIIPAHLYEAATRNGSVSAAAQQSPINPGVPAIPRQMSGHAQVRTGSPLRPNTLDTQVTGGDWVVSPAEKANYDKHFRKLAKQDKSFPGGKDRYFVHIDSVVDFFRKISGNALGPEVLWQIWQIANFNSYDPNCLTEDEFAVAMWLIMQSREKGVLPQPLPENLFPAYRRNLPRPQASNSAYDASPVPQPAPRRPPKTMSAMDYLSGLDSSSSNPAPAAANKLTGGPPAIDPFAGGPESPSLNTPSSALKPVHSGSTFKPFNPTSSFGQALTTQPPSASGSISHQFSAADDLLSDPEPEESKKISSESTELANLSNQIKSLATQTQETQAKKATTQNEINQTVSQKQMFEQRLGQLRTLYEKEAEDTRALKEHLRISRQDTGKLRGECMTLEDMYRDIQAEHQEVSLALQEDQQENTRLKERIRVVNAEIDRLKPEIDKLKSATRRQKGLVAIYKKQLSTAEGERDKFKAEAEELSKTNEESRRQSNASSSASPTARIASPAPSTSSGNNPFFKRSDSTDIMGAFASPPSRSNKDNALDRISGPAGSSGTPPPVTSFTQQYTGTSAASVSSAPTPASSSPNVSRQGTLTAEPPAPPESRQISSSFLPFPERTESLSSSRQVSPPASRCESSVKDSQQPLSAEATTSQGASLPGAFPGDSDKDTTGAIPNLAGVKVTAPVEDDAKASGNPARASNPFAGMDNARAKEEFDNAFAAFSSASTAREESATEGTKSKSAFDSEFPPISELARDDESDSESERGGFDDDFAATWPEQQMTAASKAPEATADELKEAVDKSPKQTSSPATITARSAAGASQSNVDDILGPASAGAAQQANQKGPSNNVSKGSLDDLEDDFEGLEDAKEGSADDDFANISRSGLEDFNPGFDSSPPPSQAKSESTAFGNESSFDFISSNTVSGAPAPASGNQQKGADSYDWDAIFSGLDSPNPAAPPAQNNESTNTLSAPENRPPGPGRALTEEGEHDDPILKDLMGLGYSRPTAVAALEKFDYNLEKAANHLASQS